MSTVVVVLGLALALALALAIGSLLHRIEVLEHENLRLRQEVEHTQTDLTQVMMQRQVQRQVSSDLALTWATSSRANQDDIFEQLARPRPVLPAPPPKEEPVTSKRETLRFPAASVYKRLLQDDDD